MLKVTQDLQELETLEVLAARLMTTELCSLTPLDQMPPKSLTDLMSVSLLALASSPFLYEELREKHLPRS